MNLSLSSSLPLTPPLWSFLSTLIHLVSSFHQSAEKHTALTRTKRQKADGTQSRAKRRGSFELVRWPETQLETDDDVALHLRLVAKLRDMNFIRE